MLLIVQTAESEFGSGALWTGVQSHHFQPAVPKGAPVSLDRQLIDSIKTHFTAKSSAQLQEILRAEDRNHWSEEAFAAAREILLDRETGRAKAPKVPMVEPPPPPEKGGLDIALSLATFWAAGLLGAGVILTPTERDTDQPVPFGSDVAWLAIDSTDTAAVAVALGLSGLRETTWTEGVTAARGRSVFVTPPVGDWTLVVGACLLRAEGVGEFVKPLLESLSRHFREAQYFGNHSGVGLCVWARAQKGGLLRGYGWLAEKRQTLWNVGAPTREERKLGCKLSTVPEEEQTGADENNVLHLASLWSVDPTTLDEYFKEPIPGLLGDVLGQSGRDSRPWRRDRRGGA